MNRFLLKGLFRDRQRSLLPVIIVAAGVMLTVFLHTWLTGIMQDGIELNARFITGHVKVMTRAYAADKDQLPNDLALTGTDSLLRSLRETYPGLDWQPRIRFGGLLDVADSSGETRAQGPVFGIAVDLLSPRSTEKERLKLPASLRKGRLPQNPGEILISDEFASKLHVGPGGKVTLIGSGMNGEMAMANFSIAGTLSFGASSLDRGTIITDISDIRGALDMQDACGEIVGFFNDGYYQDAKAGQVVSSFNSRYTADKDEFAPQMSYLRTDNQMAMLLDYSSKISGMLVAVFILAMSVVLWNAGLLGGLRRYGEFGLRLAMGETKNHIYRTQIIESVMIGITGTILGTALGLGISYIVQENGISAGDMMKNASMMLPSSFHTRITPAAFYLGFIPGLLSTVLGTLLAGMGIYRRKTAQLFKELEN